MPISLGRWYNMVWMEKSLCDRPEHTGTDDLVFKIEKKSSEKTGTAISFRKNVILLSALEYAILIQCEIT